MNKALEEFYSKNSDFFIREENIICGEYGGYKVILEDREAGEVCVSFSVRPQDNDITPEDISEGAEYLAKTEKDIVYAAYAGCQFIAHIAAASHGQDCVISSVLASLTDIFSSQELVDCCMYCSCEDDLSIGLVHGTAVVCCRECAARVKAVMKDVNVEDKSVAIPKPVLAGLIASCLLLIASLVVLAMDGGVKVFAALAVLGIAVAAASAIAFAALKGRGKKIIEGIKILQK